MALITIVRRIVDQLPGEIITTDDVLKLAEAETGEAINKWNVNGILNQLTKSGAIEQIRRGGGVGRPALYRPIDKADRAAIAAKKKEKKNATAKQANIDLHETELDEFRVGGIIIGYIEKLKQKLLKYESELREVVGPLKKENRELSGEVDALREKVKEKQAEIDRLRSMRPPEPSRSLKLADVARITTTN